jgi:hypothetical protein
MPWVAGSGRDRRKRTTPTLGTHIVAQWRLSRSTVTSRTQKPSSTPALRHRGRRCVPAHQLRSARSKSRSACCCTEEDPSPSQVPLRASANWRIRSAAPGVGGRHGRSWPAPTLGSTRSGRRSNGGPASPPGRCRGTAGSGEPSTPPASDSPRSGERPPMAPRPRWTRTTTGSTGSGADEAAGTLNAAPSTSAPSKTGPASTTPPSVGPSPVGARGRASPRPRSPHHRPRRPRWR